MERSYREEGGESVYSGKIRKLLLLTILGPFYLSTEDIMFSVDDFQLEKQGLLSGPNTSKKP